MVDAIVLSKYIVTKCMKDKKPISNLQLQKILYYIQVEFVRNRDCRVFIDDIEAWQFGPCVRSVYQKFCGSGSFPLRFEYENADNFNAEDKKVIDGIIEEKRDKEPWDLVDDVHADGKPWSCVYQNGKGNKNIIPLEYIKKYG